jgi:hypothetical protein
MNLPKTVLAFVLVTGLILLIAIAIPAAPQPLPVIHVPTIPVLPILVDRESGSVIFWHDTFGVKIIDRHTGSTITHAAIVLNGYVYEAVPPCVHKVRLDEYLKQMAGGTWNEAEFIRVDDATLLADYNRHGQRWNQGDIDQDGFHIVMHPVKHKATPYFITVPKKPFTRDQIAAMVKYAESQLGRLYGLRGFDKRETLRIFCSELVGNTIEQSGLIKSANFHESPGSLKKKLEPFYSEKDTATR